MRTEYHFKRGHARFETGDLEGARGDLLRVKEDPAAQPEFLEASEYYLAHIAFAEDRLTTALEAFEALSAIDAFKDAVPLYIGKSSTDSNALKNWQTGTDWLSEERDLARGDQQGIDPHVWGSPFHLGDCTSLRPIWNRPGPRRPPRAHPGFQLHRGHLPAFNWKPQHGHHRTDAGHRWQHSTGPIRHPCDGPRLFGIGRKAQSPAAFAKAATMDHDMEVREDALFNQAKLAFETDFNPFNDAIAAFEQYLKNTPTAPAETRPMVSCSMSTSPRATTSGHWTPWTRSSASPPRKRKPTKSWPSTMASTCFKADNLTRPDAFFKRSRSFPEDATLAAESHYWQGKSP